MKEREINAGYEIIERFPVGEQGFAIGHSETAPASHGNTAPQTSPISFGGII